LHESVKASPGGLGIQTQCVDPQKLGSSAWYQELGKIEFVFRIMRWCLCWPGSPKNVPTITECISIIPVSPYVYILRELDNLCNRMK
jgi:hypothetical protein